MSPRSSSDSPRSTRRRFLSGVAGTTLVSLSTVGTAGCLGDDSPADDDFPEGVQFDTDWPTYAHDDANSAYLREGGAVSDPIVEYEADFGMPLAEPAAIGALAYTANDPLQIVDVTGGEVISEGLGDSWTTPVVLDGALYTPTQTVQRSTELLVYDARSGREIRSIELPGSPTTAPAFSNQRRTMFVGLTDERICAVDLDSGEVRWTRDLFGAVRNPLAVNLGLVFVVTEGQRLYCLGTDGSGYWQVSLNTANPVAPVVGDERVYVAGWDRIAALEKRNGSVVWEDDRGVHKRLAFDGERLYCSKGDLRALDTATGDEQWSYSSADSAPTVAGDTVYVGTDEGNLVALKRGGTGPLDGRERWSILLGDYVGHSLAATDNRVFCPVTRADGLMSLTVVADDSIAGPNVSGTAAAAGGDDA
ncbi:PQQ-binding-like beta-propeller repeat protein [Haloferax elongans]|uniref:PQQ-binding-like beta-propeller repeat protein n=1 Tax=Haloferax elongans TaxID=403191 RepID=UPI00187DB77E|nr:PQQ-binding-like beta-propeller repeat protein [Haloferax elongans]